MGSSWSRNFAHKLQKLKARKLMNKYKLHNFINDPAQFILIRYLKYQAFCWKINDIWRNDFFLL